MKGIKARAVWSELCYRFPEQKPLFDAVLWTISGAAKAWGVSYDCAKRYIWRHPQEAIIVQIQEKGKRPRFAICVPIGAKKHTSTRGNPYFRDSAYQRELGSRQWVRRADRERAERKKRWLF